MKTAMIIALAIFCTSAPLHAQPGFMSATSIDAVVANSDHVFIGTIKKYETVESGDEFGTTFLRVWFEDVENLKGPLEGPTSLPFKGDVFTRPYSYFGHPLGQSLYYPEVLDGVKERGNRLFVATGDGRPYAMEIHDEAQVLTADFRLLTGEESIIQAAKDTIARIPANVKRLHTLTLWKPEWIELDMGQAVQLTVPIDSQLEELSTRLLESKIPAERISGLEVIRYFKTEENIARAKKLLDDPFKEKVWKADVTQECNSFKVREAAWNVFQAWGVEVDKRVLREELQE